MFLNIIWIIDLIITRIVASQNILFFEKPTDTHLYTTVLGGSLNIKWNLNVDIQSQINYFEVYLSKESNNIRIANMIVGNNIHVTPDISSYVSQMSYTSIAFKQVPLSFDQSMIHIKVFFNNAIDSEHYQSDYYSPALHVFVEPYGKCEHLNSKLFITNQIKCVVISKPAAKMKVVFEVAPVNYKINEIRQKSNLNYTNETTFIISFVAQLEQHESNVKVSFTNNQQTELNLNVQLKFDEKPRFECSNPTEYDGKITVNCHCFNSLTNKYSMKFKINNIEEDSKELQNYWSVQTQQMNQYAEMSTFTIDKGWLLQTPTVTVEVKSKRINNSRTLGVIFSKTSLPMGINFYFVDRITGKKSDFNCGNLKNGIIPICRSISDKDGKFQYRIYNPLSKLYPPNEPIIIDKFDNRLFGLWSCKITNSNGMVMVSTTFTINDSPCTSKLTVHGTNEHLEQVTDDIYRIHKKEFLLRCNYIGFPEPTYYHFEDVFHPHRSFSSITNEVEVNDLANGNYSYWTCTVFNGHGSRSSVTTAVFYEAYNIHKPRLWMALASLTPIASFILIFFILIIYILVMERKDPSHDYQRI